MATVTGGVEVARDAAGRSLEQEQKMQGTPPPQPKSHFVFNPAPLLSHIHTHASQVLKRKCLGRKTVSTYSSRLVKGWGDMPVFVRAFQHKWDKELTQKKHNARAAGVDAIEQQSNSTECSVTRVDVFLTHWCFFKGQRADERLFQLISVLWNSPRINLGYKKFSCSTNGSISASVERL